MYTGYGHNIAVFRLSKRRFKYGERRNPEFWCLPLRIILLSGIQWIRNFSGASERRQKRGYTFFERLKRSTHNPLRPLVTKEIDMEAMEARRRGGPRAPVVLLLVAAALPAAAAFGFGAAPTGGLGRPACLRSSCAARQRPMLRAEIRMDRKDGGADKISKPGTSKPGGAPGKGAGGGGAGERESEGGGAGVAVLTKPPDVDKVNLSPCYAPCWPFAPAVCACVDVCV
jgi:hypothetical protein